MYMVNYLHIFILCIFFIFLFLFQCLCLIGEAFDNAEDVNGAVVNVRQKQDKVGKFKLRMNMNNNAQHLHYSSKHNC